MVRRQQSNSLFPNSTVGLGEEGNCLRKFFLILKHGAEQSNTQLLRHNMSLKKQVSDKQLGFH